MSAYDLLKGIKVVDLSTYAAAPACVQLLSDMGADVIKVESQRGDPSRVVASAFEVPIEKEESPLYEIWNSRKKNIAINLKEEKGREILYKLLEDADVMVTNNRQKALVRMGLDYDSVKEKNPRLVYGHLLGYGERGPLKDAPGLDTAAFFAKSGFLGDVVKEGEYPITSPYAFGDAATGTALFGAICAALVRQGKTGKGGRVSVSLYGASIWYSSCMVTCAQDAYGAKFPKKRNEGIPTLSPYRCSDGEWILLSFMDWRHFAPLCERLGAEDAITDPRFADMETVMKDPTPLIQLFEERIGKFSINEMVEMLTELDIPFEQVRHFSDVTKDEQALANGYVTEFTFRNGNKAFLPRSPIDVTGQERPEMGFARDIGEDAEEIVQSLGYTEAEYKEMKANGVI